MSAVALPVAVVGGRALWYLTRSTGLVALLLLTSTVVLGVVASVGWTTERWPRFLSQGVHRNLSLFCVGFVALHVVTTVSDGYVPIGFADAFLPFLTPYRPLWVGLGALAFDLLLVVLVTSALRHRIGYDSWRFVHWLAYLCWPIAMFHSLGSGSDSALPVALGLDAVCTAAVIAAVAWRVSTGRTFSAGRRAAASVGAVVVVFTIAVFASVGPLRPGWSHRSGTSSALLAQLARKSAGAAPAVPSGSAGAGTLPTAPFTYNLTGSQTTSAAGAQGQVQATLSMRLQDPSSTPLTVTLNGTPAQGGGIAMTSGSVTFGPYQGPVTSLDGGTVVATVATPGPETLTMSLQVDPNSGALAGTVTGTERVTLPVSPAGLRSSSAAAPTVSSVTAPSGSARLLTGVAATSQPVALDEHLERWGVLPRWKGATFIDEIERSGLRGRGGGWFPVGTKWRSVHRVGMRRPVVVANGSESEPASGKDRLLLSRFPHLVLDGAVVAALSVGAPDVVVHVPAFRQVGGRPRPRRTAASGSRPMHHRCGDRSRQLPGRTGVGGGQHHQREKSGHSVVRCAPVGA